MSDLAALAASIRACRICRDRPDGAPLWRNPLRSAMMLFANWVSRREIARKHAAVLAGPEAPR